MNTDKTHIDKLLGRYYEGLSTLTEENELREYFSGEVAPEYESDKAVFRSLSTPVKAPEELTRRVEAMADNGDRRFFFSPFARRVAAAAAVSVVAVATAVFYLGGNRSPRPSQMTPEEVRAQTEMALNMFADAMQKGYDAIDKAETTTVNATDKAFETLNKSL